MDPSDSNATAAVAIVVQASSPGLTSATVVISLSTDEAVDGVLAAAAASVTNPLYFE